MRALPKQVSKYIPIFRVAADEGTHPPVGLDRAVCVVGRGEEFANLPLPAREVSKLHALIVREQRRVYVRDLASTNGVEVNGAPVREAGLSDADTVRIGSYTLKCQSGFGRGGQRPADPATGAAEAPDAPPAPPAELRGEAGTFPISHNGRHTLLIGQRKGCDVLLKHPSVAPVHAVLFEMDGKHHVHTFAAAGGTRLNGKPVHREELKPGDELQIGEVALTYALADAATATRAANGKAPPAGRKSLSANGAAATAEELEPIDINADDSLIQPALDSSITPAPDHSLHGELEPEGEPPVDVLDVLEVESSHDSLIEPAMESAAAPSPAPAPAAAAPAAPAAPALSAEAAAGDADDEFGLELEPIDDHLADLVAERPQQAERPAEPPRAEEPLPVEELGAFEEPVVAPAAERAAESTDAGLPLPMDLDDEPASEPTVASAAEPSAPAAPAGRADAAPPADDLNDIPPLDLGPATLSDSALDPIGLGNDPDPAFEGELEESFRANWEAAAKRQAVGLSATFDENDTLMPLSDPVEPAPAPAPRPAPAPAPAAARGTKADDFDPSATFDEDDGLVPLTEPADDAGLLADDDAISGDRDLSDDAPRAAQRADDRPATPAEELAPATPGPREANLAPGAGAAGTAAGQAARLTELAKLAGLEDGGNGRLQGKTPRVHAAPANAASVSPSAPARRLTHAEIGVLIDELSSKLRLLKEAFAEMQAPTGEGGDNSSSRPSAGA